MYVDSLIQSFVVLVLVLVLVLDFDSRKLQICLPVFVSRAFAAKAAILIVSGMSSHVT